MLVTALQRPWGQKGKLNTLWWPEGGVRVLRCDNVRDYLVFILNDGNI